jgi:hypothetical protein
MLKGACADEISLHSRPLPSERPLSFMHRIATGFPDEFPSIPKPDRTAQGRSLLRCRAEGGFALLALRNILRRHTRSVVSKAKRTLHAGQDRVPRSRMSHSSHATTVT